MSKLVNIIDQDLASFIEKVGFPKSAQIQTLREQFFRFVWLFAQIER
jgi:hypothetical protein